MNKYNIAFCIDWLEMTQCMRLKSEQELYDSIRWHLIRSKDLIELQDASYLVTSDTVC